MKRWLFQMGFAVLAGGVLAGCNTLSGPPEIRNVSLNPSTLYPGDMAVLTVAVQDRDNVIDRVEGVVQGAPDTVFRLRDDGVHPDQVAGDGIWTMEVDVPLLAPPGEYVLILTAFRRDGEPVPVRDAQGNVVPLQQTSPFVVQYAQEP